MQEISTRKQTMEFLALIPATILPFFILWLTWKVVRKVWRVLMFWRR